MQVDFLNGKVTQAQQTLQDALVVADTVSRDQGKTIKELEQTVEELKEAKISIEEVGANEKQSNEENK